MKTLTAATLVPVLVLQLVTGARAEERLAEDDASPPEAD